jgi:hypothetical protein
MRFKTAARDAYYDGVADGVMLCSPDPSTMFGGKSVRELETIRRQGFYDVKSQRVLRSHQFDVDVVLRRAEVRLAR